jgi:Amt family ammonium transporter
MFLRKPISGQDKNIRVDFNGIINGMLAGLVAITGPCYAVDPWAALVIGFIAGI